MNTSVLVAIVIIMCIGAVGMLVGFVIITHNRGQKDSLALIEDEFSKSARTRFMSKVYQKAYMSLVRTKLFKRYMLRIRKRLESVHSYDEFTLRRESARIVLISFTITLVVVVGLLFINQEITYILWVLFGALVLNNIIVDFFVNRVEDKLLSQLTIFFEDVRHFYQEHKMVDEAIYEATQVAPKEAAVHANRIYDVLTSDDPGKEIEAYYTVAPNKYFKAFVGISNMIMEYGDKVTNKGSAYLASLARLVKEINMEKVRKERLQYKLQGLVAVSLFPVVFLEPIERWAVSYFPVMESFYDGKIGFAVKIFIFALVFLCYMMLRRVSQTDYLKVPTMRGKKGWQYIWPKRVYESKFGQKIVQYTCPPPRTRKHHKTMVMLKDVNSPLTVEWFHINRLTLGIIGFVLSIVFFVGMHFMAIHSIMTAPTNLDMSLGQPTEEAIIYANELTQYDNAIIEHFRGTIPTVQQISEYIIDTHGETNTAVIIQASDRIYNKIIRLENEVFKWWELALSFLIAYVLYLVPMWFQMFQRRMKKMDMQSEVDEFHVIISILAQFERMSVEVIVEWMERFSIIFKEPLQTCLINYDAGAEEALEQLKLDAPFTSFVRIVEKLQLAVERIPIKEAFDDLESEMEYYAEQRKLHNEKVVEQKSTWGLWLGFAPGLAIIFLYLVIPLLVVSALQMQDYIGQMRDFQNF